MASYIDIEPGDGDRALDHEDLGIDTRTSDKDGGLWGIHRCRGGGRLGRLICAARDKDEHANQQECTGHQCNRTGANTHIVRFILWH